LGPGQPRLPSDASTVCGTQADTEQQEFPNTLAFHFRELDPNQSAAVLDVAMQFQTFPRLPVE
ncbi:hypothetical protein EK904_005506, partial [Melospiza melodia maxima]